MDKFELERLIKDYSEIKSKSQYYNDALKNRIN